jgi:protein-tyrosine phosphatase
MLVVFVCTANRCRSPMAEAFARARHSAPGVRFASAGTWGVAGEPATSDTVTGMAEVGIDLTRHRSSPLSLLGDDPPDLVYAMTPQHADQIVTRFPELVEQVRLLRHDGRPIKDPYGRDLPSYRASRDEIAAAVAARAVEWSQGR